LSIFSTSFVVEKMDNVNKNFQKNKNQSEGAAGQGAGAGLVTL
jgi:hypothetical protein